MKKIAIFVEGQTESIFVAKFLCEYLGSQNICLRREVNRKGFISLEYEDMNTNASFYFLIYDVSGDGNINPAVIERAERLFYKSDYCCLLVLRDLYPKKKNEFKAITDRFHKLISGFLFRNQIKLIIAIMEIEAWFLADRGSFLKIFNKEALDDNLISDKLNKILEKDDPEMYNHPTKIIKKIYRLSGATYKKREDQSYKIAYNIDYSYLICSEDMSKKVKSFKYFVDRINECIE